MNITGDTLRKIRRVHGLTQRQLAARLGVSYTLIQLMEAGKRSITDKMARAIIEAYELTPDKLAEIEAIYAKYHA